MSMFPHLHVKRLHERAIVPRYQSAGAACFDLHALLGVLDQSNPLGMEQVIIRPGESYDFRIGLAFEVPDNWVMLVYSRSGHGFKSGVRLANSTGVIDSDFRGEMHVKLQNDGHSDFVVNHGDRVGQCLLLPAPQWRLVEVTELSATERGESGYGSTGR